MFTNTCWVYQMTVTRGYLVIDRFQLNNGLSFYHIPLHYTLLCLHAIYWLTINTMESLLLPFIPPSIIFLPFVDLFPVDPFF